MDSNMLSRLLGALSELPGYRPEQVAKPHLDGKHSQGDVKKKKDWREKKKIRRKIAKASQRRNRK